MNINKSMFKRVASAFGALALGAGIALTPSTTVLAQGVPVDVTPDYTLEKPTFTRVSTDAGWRSEYHYAPQFQPVENQCANVGHGNWARVNCWTDDGDNLIVRVEFVHPSVKPAMVRVKNDTAHTATGGQAVRKTKQYEIPAENRTPAGNPYIIFNYEYFEGQSFWIEAFASTTSSQWAWSDFTVSVTQNVNRATDTDPVVARQATVYDSNFYKLSQPLQFEKIVQVDGKYKAVYSMVNKNATEADLIDQIQIWPVDKDQYTWRPEAQDGSWAPYVQTPTRPLGCDSTNTEVPRLGYGGLGANTGFINYTEDSTEYPLIRDGAKTSIMVDVQPGWERLQYETWMTGCVSPFGRPSQMRPYQGQVTIPPFALAQVTKLVGGNLELQRVENGTTLGELDSAQEFGGTLTYPAGTLTMEHPDPSGWTGENWLGTRDYTYSAATYNWAAAANETWMSPLLPARAEVTLTENTPETTPAGDWSMDVPGSFNVGEAPLADLATLAGTPKIATNTANTVTAKCLEPEALIARAGTDEVSSVNEKPLWVDAFVANNLSLPECPPAEETPTPPAPPTPPTPPAPPVEEPPAPPLNPPAATPPTPAKPGLATTGAAVTTIAIIAGVSVLAGVGVVLAKRKEK